MAEKKVISELIAIINGWDGSTRHFKAIVAVVINSHPDGEEACVMAIARALRVSPPTVRRWGEGKSDPHPLGQSSALGAIKEMLWERASFKPSDD